MGYTLGVIVVGRRLADEELLSIFAPAHSAAVRRRADQVFDGATFSDIALGHVRDRTVLLNPDLPNEFTQDFDFLPRSQAYRDLERLSEAADILCLHVQSTSGVLGHALFSGGKRREAAYKSPGEWVTAFDDPAATPSEASYDERSLFARLDSFFGDDFRRWMTAGDAELSTYRWA